jgi:hypothetical protein
MFTDDCELPNMTVIRHGSADPVLIVYRTGPQEAQCVGDAAANSATLSANLLWL